MRSVVIKMMKIKVSNKIYIQDPSLSLIEWCHKNMVLDNPDYYMAEKMGRWTGNIEKYLYLYEYNGSKLILPLGVWVRIWQPFISGKAELEQDFSPYSPLMLQGGINLYPYQQDALNALKSAKNGVLQAPCGSGKTQMGIALIKELGQKALWITHTTDLLNQSMNRAKQYFSGDFGVITDGKVHIGSDITFATVQTLAKIDLTQYNDQWNVVIVDECHRAAGSPTKVKQFYKVLSHLKARHKYGLSATLDRADGLIQSVFALLGDIVYTITDQEVGSKIIKAQHIIIPTNLDDDIEQYVGTDGTLIYSNLIDYIYKDDDRNKLIIETIQAKSYRHQLILSHRVDHLYILKDLLNHIGIQSAIIYAGTPKGLREATLDQVRSGQIKVLLATYNLAKEGLDIPILDTLHLVTPNKNKSIVIQSVGRIERNIDGKNQPEINDYVDFNIGYCLGMYKKRKNIILRK